MEEKEVTNNLAKILDHNDENIDLTLSYSKLSDFDRNGGIALVRKSILDNNGVKLGSLVDDLLFDEDNFNNKYYIFDGEKPTATLGIITDIILNNYMEIPSVDEILDIIDKNNLWKKFKIETRISYFDIPEFWNYLKCKFEAGDKIIVTTSEHNTSLELVSILKTHNYSKNILDNNYENIYQLKFEIKYKDFIVRGIIDITSIDHENKIVYLTDLKTGAEVSTKFYNSFIKYRYYIQAAIYTLAFEDICKHLNLINYTLAPFQFLYISKKDKTPLVYRMTNKWLKAAFNGFKLDSEYYKGIDELIDEIYWCWKNKEYEIPKIIVEQNGNIELDDKYLLMNE